VVQDTHQTRSKFSKRQHRLLKPAAMTCSPHRHNVSSKQQKQKLRNRLRQRPPRAEDRLSISTPDRAVRVYKMTKARGFNHGPLFWLPQRHVVFDWGALTIRQRMSNNFFHHGRQGKIGQPVNGCPTAVHLVSLISGQGRGQNADVQVKMGKGMPDSTFKF